MPDSRQPVVHSIRLPLVSALTPAEVMPWLRDDRRPFVLQGEWFGFERGTVLGSNPVRVADPATEDPFALLDQPRPEHDGEALIGGGWVGWLGYGLGARLERLPPSPPAPIPRRGYSLAFHDHVLIHDGERWWFEALTTENATAAAIDAHLRRWQNRLSAAPPAARPARVGQFKLRPGGPGAHLYAVDDCRRRIAAGDLFQANICMRLEAELEGDALDLAPAALAAAAPRFGALVDGVLSLSPERFLRSQHGEVQTEPIKGTRPRLGDPATQAAAGAELEASLKDEAEHVMIVDLMRNDLGRVCRYGSVEAQGPRLEAHAGVWHLVSTVSGALRDGITDGQLLRATFPPGSVTGAPKIQAMKVISELEQTAREAYTGTIGMVSPLAGLDLNVAIRTFEFAEDRVWFGAGGGVVADSEADQELAEAFTKASGPTSALGSGAPMPPRPLPRPTATRFERALDHGSRPDPRCGVLETLLADAGRAVELDAHLARLARSVLTLFGLELPDGLAGQVRAVAEADPTRLRIRVIVEPDGAVRIAASAAPAPVAVATVRLRPYVLPGGLGEHKWADRRLMDALVAAAPGTMPLLLDADGSVLEAASANIWIREGEHERTPPTDGRILAGVTRAQRLRDGSAAATEPLSVQRLLAADAVYLTSSIAGIRPAIMEP